MSTIEQARSNSPEQSHSWSNLGESLGSALGHVGISRDAIGTALLVGTGLLAGCSPGEKSFWMSSYSELPPPPPDTRMQLGTAPQEGSQAFINYIVWNQSKGEFERKDIHYTNGFAHPGTFSEAGGYTQKIADGEVLYGGAMVDQARSRIVLTDGKYIDGKSGNTYTSEGTLLKEFRSAERH